MTKGGQSIYCQTNLLEPENLNDDQQVIIIK